jgi:hypothetical protein
VTVSSKSILEHLFYEVKLEDGFYWQLCSVLMLINHFNHVKVEQIGEIAVEVITETGDYLAIKFRGLIPNPIDNCVIGNTHKLGDVMLFNPPPDFALTFLDQFQQTISYYTLSHEVFMC